MIIQRGGIKENLRVLVAACLHYSGLVKLAHWCTRRSGQRLIILNYHRATGGICAANCSTCAVTIASCI